MSKHFRADLHCHTNCSDGSMTPEEIVIHAKECKLSGLSITDHDCIDAYKTAIPAAKKADILLGSGVEFSSTDQKVSVHVLGYDFDLENRAVHAFCERHVARRKDRNQRIVEKLARYSMPIDAEELASESRKGRPVGRPHIALILMRKGYISSLQEAFDRFIGDGKPCYDPGIPIQTDETIEVIHQAGGKAFIAHPHLIRERSCISRLLQKPFDGIECYYSRCSPNQEAKWLNIAKERGLLISGGSDFHGKIKPNIPLGCSWVDQPTFEKLFFRKL